MPRLQHSTKLPAALPLARYSSRTTALAPKGSVNNSRVGELMPVQNLDRFTCTVESEIRAFGLEDVLGLAQLLSSAIRSEPAPTVTVNATFKHGSVTAPPETLLADVAAAEELGPLHSWNLALAWRALNSAAPTPAPKPTGWPAAAASSAAQAGGTCTVTGNLFARLVSVVGQKLTRDERDRCEQTLRELLPPDPLRRGTEEVTAQLVESQREQAKLLHELKVIASNAASTSAAAADALGAATALLEPVREAAAFSETIKTAVTAAEERRVAAQKQADALEALAATATARADELAAASAAATKTWLEVQQNAEATAKAAVDSEAAAGTAKSAAEAAASGSAAVAARLKATTDAAAAIQVAKTDVDNVRAAVQSASQQVENKRSAVESLASSIDTFKTQFAEMMKAGEDRVLAAESKAKDAVLKCEAAGDAIATRARVVEADLRTASDSHKKTLDGQAAEGAAAAGKALQASQDRLRSSTEQELEQWRDAAGKLLGEHRETHQSLVAETKIVAATASKLEVDVKKLLFDATSGALGVEFQQRKNEIARVLWRWVAALILNTLALTGIYGLFAYQAGNVKDLTLAFVLARLGVGAPLLVLEWFIVRQYGKRQRGIEEYAFKNAIALSMKAYIEQIELKDLTSEGRQFVLDAVRRIYEHPLADPPSRRGNEPSLTSAVLGAGERVVSKGFDKAVEKVAGAAGLAKEEG